ncbi:hypothetical protein BT93_L1527 [Corymbia citriodora subsp. variegata]|uniref:Uncharacterized protein n=1 Tax=Corymbia citriodora subsp. variegata TaxID=360336 RepID=A0A8T0CSD5_CORYI|nr:hypothetical protein BT93_L1527 [Corymbia citriodora subsp. variegata]
MGNCAAPQITRNGGRAMTTHHHSWPSSSPSTLKLIHTDGRLQEFTQTIKASHLLSQNPNCFLCSSESMFINSIVPQIHEEEDLYLGQLYFLLPLSMSRVPLSIRELCMLAIKANAVLKGSSCFRGSKDGVPSVANHPRRCGASTGFDAMRLDLGQSTQRIEL